MQRENTRNLFVITGGPGAGKTTLAEHLQKAGFTTAPEAGRAIIRAQSAIGGNALPDKDPALYAELMLGWELRSHLSSLQEHGPVFFDRGIPDVLGYLRLIALPTPPHILRAAELFRYNTIVFIAPFWPDIYAHDRERTQSPAEARRTYEAMCEVYTELGYRLEALPCASVQERLDFVLERSKAA